MICFTTMSLARISTTLPPPPTKNLPRLGACCFKATCSIRSCDKDIASVTGYNRSPIVAQDTERACKVVARENDAWQCSAATLVMVPGNAGQPCGGETYFYMGAKTKRLL